MVEDSDGNVVERKTGLVHGTYLFDTLVTTSSGGITDLELRISGPHPSRERHPCDYAAELIG